jgi:[NiFe] hydrogenase assembly HybE family chaperone
VSRAACELSAAQASRVQALVDVFVHVADTRMRDLPVVNARLHVEAVGCRAVDAESLVGVLITPWFMNLVWLPCVSHDSAQAVGNTRTLDLGPLGIELIAAYEPGVGQFASCSLYSPLHQFADQAAASATAQEVMAQLEQLGAFETRTPDAQRPVLSRRGFLGFLPQAGHAR